MASNSTSVSVVVTVLNDAEGSAALIDALAAQTHPADEVIIVDGGSTDDTVRLLRRIESVRSELRVIAAPGAGIAQGRNIGVRAARNEIVATTDAGCEPDRDWLRRLVEPFDDPAVSVVGGSYQIDPKSRIERILGLLTMPGQLAAVEPARFNPSARSMAFRVAAWRTAGGFPEWLHTAEDTLFDCKLRQLGLVYAHAKDAVVRWRPRSGLRPAWRQFRDYARGEARIGRGDEVIRFWQRRYGIAAGLLVAASTACMLHGGGAAILTGLAGALACLALPLHGQAARISRKTLRPLDYLLAMLVGHWISMANIVGWRAGIADRRRRPERFVEPLRAYFGTDRVGETPPWRLTRLPMPHTVVVSWHWPPTPRASTGVLSNLFRAADPGAFHVVTRRLPSPETAQALHRPTLPTHEVPGSRNGDDPCGWRSWLAYICCAGRMVFAVRRLHRAGRVERILVVHPHRYGVLAGWIAARWLGVPLVAYMHDLMAETLQTNSPVKRRFWDFIDRRALTDARLVIVPTREFAEHYYQRGVVRTWVLPHCRPLDVRASEPASAREVLRLLYSGSIYQAHEDAARIFLDVASQLPNVEATFLTNRNSVVPDDCVSWLARPQSIRRMHAADVLVVLLASDTPYPAEIQGCFPSKIVDYLAVGRPILAIVPPGCFVDRLIRQTGCGIAVTDFRKRSVAAAINALRDQAVRQRMCVAARQLAEQLDARDWMRLLCKRLACGAPPHPESPHFPQPRLTAASVAGALATTTAAGGAAP